MGHTSSGILDLYFEMYDPTADAAMATLDYEKASDKGDGVKESPASREAKKNRKAGRRKSRVKIRSGEPTKRWKVTSRKRSTGNSG